MEAKCQFHSQIEATAERSSEEGLLTLNSGLNSLQNGKIYFRSVLSVTV